MDETLEKETSNADNLSITSAERKMLDGPDLSDIDSLIMDFDDSDAEGPRPVSPLLLESSFARARQKTKNIIDVSSRPNLFSAADGKTGCAEFNLFSNILGSPKKNRDVFTRNSGTSSKQVKMTTQERGSTQSPCSLARVKQSKRMSAPAKISPRKQKPKKLRNQAARVSPILPPGNSAVAGLMKPRSMLESPSFASNCGGSGSKCTKEADGDEEGLQSAKSRRIDGDTFRNDDDDIISLYARDEDYFSLYNNFERSNNTREVAGEMLGAKQQNSSRCEILSPTSANNRKVILQPNPSVRKGGANERKDDKARLNDRADLRSRITSRPCSSAVQKSRVDNIKKLLNENTKSQTLFAAVTFCKAYMDHQIKIVNHDFRLVTRRLADMLLRFREMRHLYRIVRLSVDMQIVLSDQVLSGLIDHLGLTHEPDKITVILNQVIEIWKSTSIPQTPFKALASPWIQFHNTVWKNYGQDRKLLIGETGLIFNPAYLLRKIREKSLPCGGKVYDVANKYLKRLKKQSPHHLASAVPVGKPPMMFHTATVESRQQLPQINGVNCSSDARSKAATAETKSIVKSAPCNGSKIDWNEREPIYIQISNGNETMPFHRNTYASRFVTVEKEEKKKDDDQQAPAGLAKIMWQEEQSTSRLEGLSSKHLNADLLGKSIGYLIEAVGEYPVQGSLYIAMADLITCGPRNADGNGDVCPVFIPFLKSALQFQSTAVKIGTVRTWLSWIGVEVIGRLSRKNAYTMARFMKSMGLQLVPPVADSNASQCERKKRFQFADGIILACLDENDIGLAMQLINEYFASDNSSDAGPVVAPLLCQTLCSVATCARNSKRFLDAAKCLSLLPAGFGDGSEIPLMEQVLLGLVTSDRQNTAEDGKICNGMVEQMLARSMATHIRRVIVKAFCANVLPVFKFLEAKGVYRRPQIADCPHLVVIPYILSIEEMALVLQRHLTELSQFLMEMQQKIRSEIPIKILICKNIGSLESLSPNENKNLRAAYQAGVNRLCEAIHSVLNPNLRMLNREMHPERQEILINVNVNSVRLWMLANTKYDERAVFGIAEHQVKPITPSRTPSPVICPLIPRPGKLGLLPIARKRNARLMI